MAEALGVALNEGWILWLLVAIFALVIGSFLNVVIHRIPRQLLWAWDTSDNRGPKPPGVAWPGSHCPSCEHPLSWRDNLPVLSYALLRGRCRYCAQAISARYPLIELLCAALSLAVVAHFGLSLMAVAALFFTWFLLALAFIDLEHQLLPDRFTMPLMAMGLAVNAYRGFVDLNSAMIGAGAGYLSLWLIFHAYRLITGKEGFGYGDFKLLAAIGAWVGWQLLPMVVLLSAGTGAVVGIALVITRRHQRGQPMPFGPFLAGGGWLAILYGEDLQRWYFSTAGL